MGSKTSKKADCSIDEHIHLSDPTIDLLTCNTDFTRDQIIKIHQEFLRDCPTGLLYKKDFIKMYKNLHANEKKRSKADKYCEYVFTAFDSDNNGYIDFSEFAIAYSVTTSGLTPEKIKMAFKIFDLDKNNLIDRKEMLRVVESLYDLNGIQASERKGSNSVQARVEQIMRQIDKNGDELINIDEFISGCLCDESVKRLLIDQLYQEN